MPWITGSPYALYAHVRAITNKGVTSWSAPYGFNVRWSSVPKDLNSTHPGLVRWSPVEGATAYQVWIYGAKRTFMTTTNVADARDLYTFHRTNPFFTGSIQFRVRAQRTLYGEVVSGLPVTTYGPWSPIYTDVQPPLSLGTLGNVAAVSDIQSDTSPGLAHALSPGFAFSGDSGGLMDYNGGAPAELFRVYIATDEDCVNIVYRGAIVGSPAYAPRTTGPLELPTDTDDTRICAREHPRPWPRGRDLDARRHRLGDERGGSRCGRNARRCPPLPPSRRPAAKVDLPDTAWPTGGYYWTVVPVVIEPKPDNRSRRFHQHRTPIRYRETELPQDACQSGRVMRFGKTTPPVVTSSSRPFASGLSPKGRLTSAATHDAFVLRHAARCLGVRPRRPGVRDPVEQVRKSVAAARLAGDRRPPRRCSRSSPAAGTTASVATTTRS